MKKTLSALAAALSVLLCMPLLAVPARAAVLAELPPFAFSSGAFSWRTDLSVYPDGTFEGSYHNSDLGITGPGYPDGTVFVCQFSGRFSNIHPVDAYTWSMTVETIDCLYEDGKAWIEDQVRYVASGPSGMPSVGQEMRLYLPGHPTAGFSEELLFLLEMTGTSAVNGKLDSFALHNVSEDLGFGTYIDDVSELDRLAAQWSGMEQAKTAYASTQAIEVNGHRVIFEAYALKDANGNDTNYIKLRDVASVLNGTPAQFNVGWNGSVTITTGQAYTPNGSEMRTPYSGNRAYQDASAATMVNGSPVELSAILLTDDSGNGYTYYKLRDLGAALGFTVDWSAERGIFIETNATKPTSGGGQQQTPTDTQGPVPGYNPWENDDSNVVIDTRTEEQKQADLEEARRASEAVTGTIQAGGLGGN